jgi:hypothetical protein
MERRKKLRTYQVFAILALVSATFACHSDNDKVEESIRTYSIGGTVTQSDGGAAAGASMMLVKESDGSDAGQSPANAAGEYVITGVEAGTYKLAATLAGYETGTVNITIVDADATKKDITLQKIAVPTYRIGGTVTKPDGSAAAGASVQIRRATDNTNAGQATTTDAAGAYSVGDIPAGAYHVIITLDGYEAGVFSDITVTDNNLTLQNLTLQTVTISAAAVRINYSGNEATVGNLPSDGSVTATQNGADVTLSSTASEIVEYAVSGSTSSGSLNIQSPADIRLTLNGAVIASSSALPAIRITKNEGVAVIELKGTSILSDGANNGENATLITKKGAFVFEGYGRLNISGAAKHAIAAETAITVRGGEITVASASSDGIHAEGFEISGGSLNITANGDCIDAGGGTALINGGNIQINSAADDTKGIKADAGITVGGGSIAASVSGAQSKGLSSKAGIVVSGGNLSLVTSGATTLESLGSGYDPSYCTAIKSDGDITVSGGSIQIESRKTSDGGKGISADGDIVIRGGTINISTAGDGKTYTSETGLPDSYTAACIKSNQNISLLGGSITCNSAGTGGKGISADGTVTVGYPDANNADLVLTVGTSGERFLVSGSSGGGGGTGGRPGGGGFGDNGTDYANPKAVKCEGNMTINSGTIRISCTQKNEGGEGIESKSLLTVNGGNIDIRTYDDCINAGTGIVINGGNIFCAASGQDAIDSNSARTVNGGLTIANGVRGDGEAFDSERNFQVNGGVIVGTHGGNMAMTTPAGQQRSVRIQAAAGSAIGIRNAAGEYLLLFNVPVIAGATAGTTVTVTFSDPRLTGGSYSLLTGGSITGGTTVNGYNAGGSYTGGTSKSFTI